VSKVPAIPAAITLVVLFTAAFLGIFGYFVVQGTQQTERNLEERANGAVQVVATNARWIVEVARQALRRVDLSLGPDLTVSEGEIALVQEGMPEGTDVYVVDAQATTLFSTVEGAASVSIADRDYFQAAADGAVFHISPILVSRLTDEQIFVFTRRLERDGMFAGAVMISLDGRILEDLLGSLDLEPGSTVSLVRDDGQVIARQPPADGPIDLSEHPLFTQYLPEAATGHYMSAASPVDGIARTVAYTRVPRAEIVAVASIASDGVWGEFWGAVAAVVLIVSPVLLALMAGSVWIVRLLYRDARQKRELEEAVSTNVLLFREIHHRVKNNLQSVQSLVRMQEMPENSKIDLQSRLAAMAAMHEHIYKYDRYVDIDASELVPAVVDNVLASYGTNAEVTYDVAHATIDRDHATPLSLLLSELVTNALKYAFPDGRAGRITIELTDLGQGRSRLVVSDDGVGMDVEAVDVRANMGMRLIRGVVGQMSGTHRFTCGAGTRFEAELALMREGHRDASG
jgi:two-component sensor histidine kinase